MLLEQLLGRLPHIVVGVQELRDHLRETRHGCLIHLRAQSADRLAAVVLTDASRATAVHANAC